MIDLRYPNITGTSEREQLAQMKSYLHQLVGELQFAIGGIETASSSLSYTPRESNVAPVSSSTGGGTNFASIKALIIKSADIVEAYYEEINKKLKGEYLAISDFGIYKENTQLELEASSSRIDQNYTNTQTISADLNGLYGDIVNLNSYITESAEALGARVDGVYDSIDALDSNLKGEIQASNNRIDETNNALGGLEDDLGNTKDSLNAVNDDLQSSKTALQGNINEVAGSVSLVNTLLEGAKAQLKGSIDDINVAVKDLEETILATGAYIRTGELYRTDADIPVYGVEVGQNVDVNGQEVFRKYARFTSEKLSFYDANDNEVAYISDKKLYIRIAEITVSFQIGGLIDLVMAGGDVVTKWVGVGG